MDKFEIEGGQIVNWLNQTDPQTASEILFGCSIDDGEADELLEVVEINIPSRVLVCRIGNATRRVPFALLRKGYVIDERPNTPLMEAIN